MTTELDDAKFLIAAGGDGAYSVLVTGFESARDVALKMVWGEEPPVTDADYVAMMNMLADSEQWARSGDDQDFYHYHENFEDGWLSITRVVEQH